MLHVGQRSTWERIDSTVCLDGTVGAMAVTAPAESRHTWGRRAGRSRRVRYAAVLLTVCAAVGCTSGGDRSATSDLDHYRDALADLWDGTDPRALAIEAEEAVAVCMTEAGFEYWPEPPDLAVTGRDAETAPEDPDASWIEVNGYGISTGSAVDQPAHSTVSKNQEYSAGLSPAESQAYAVALNGASSTSIEPAGDGTVDPDSQGCMATGYASVSPSMTTPAMDEVFAELNRAYASLDDLPEVAAAAAEWSECMAASDLDGFGRPSDAVASIEEELGSLQAMAQVSESVFRSMADPEGVARVQRREVALATADYACRRSVDYTARVREAEVQIENDFVAAHKDELDAWIVWYQEQLS